MSESQDAAVIEMKSKCKEIIARLANPDLFPPTNNPECIFMAGSPGAGKTETSMKMIEALRKINPQISFVRIDPDDMRKEISLYTGTNSSDMQEAAVLGAQRLLDHVLKKRQSFIYDGTFARFDKAKENVNRSLKKGFKVTILYVYQDPLIAWELTKKREKLEGRPVPIDIFVNAFFKAVENVDQIKKEFGSSVELNVATRELRNNNIKLVLGAEKVEYYIQNEYNPNTLPDLLKKIQI